MEIVFAFENIKDVLQCDMNEKMKDIFNRIAIKINKNINTISFIYDGIKLNPSESGIFLQIANNVDKKRKKMYLLIKKIFDLNDFLTSSNNKDPLVTFLRDCDLSFLSKDDFRRKNNIQPFPRLVVCASKEFDFEKAIPLETRIIRKGRKRNSFIIFCLLPNDVLFSCKEEYNKYGPNLNFFKNKEVFLDRTFWSFQRMDQLSDVCLAARGPAHDWSGCCCKKIWTNGDHICHACDYFNKPGLILVRFDTDGKAVEYYVKSRGFIGATPIGGLFAHFNGDVVENDACIAAEDNIMQRWERKDDVPYGTAYSFEDYEPTLKSKGDLFWNWQYDKWIYDNFEPKYYLCENPDSRKRSLDLTVILLPDNLDSQDIQQYFTDNKNKGNFSINVNILKEIKKHWNDDNWFEPKHKEGELEYWPSLSVQELLGIWPKEVCEKIGNCPEPKDFNYLKQ